MTPDAGDRIRHGIDLVEVARLDDTMGRTPTFETRVFTAGEREYCRGQARPAIHFAGRFAAKEACLKALGLGLGAIGIASALQDIEVVRVGTQPRIVLRGRPAQVAAEIGVFDTSISITHTDAFAIASVVMLARAREEA
jgi:holo-[acyl-carrier protein] synthase